MTTEERDVASQQTVDPDAHLQRLLNPELEEPWFHAALKNIREFFNPPKLPPLEVTSTPVQVQEIWGAYQPNGKRSGAISIGIHVGVVALLFLIFQSKPGQQMLKKAIDIYYVPPLKEYQPKIPPKKLLSGGGGGGGNHAPTPVSKGEAPKFAPKQFVPPAMAIPQPKLPVVPTITAEAPKIDAPQYGDPRANNPLFSAGQGQNGLGNGSGHGLGNGDGNGYGSGSGGGAGGGVFRIGGGVSAPAILSKIEPEYSEEARKAKYQGTVVLMIIVDEHGLPRDIRVIKALGLGLDEKAIEAVQKWRFRPGMKDGHPVKTEAQVEVNFRLL